MDEDLLVLLKQLESEYRGEGPPPPSDQETPDVFAYVRFKAFGFLRMGPEGYRRVDAFGYPPDHWPGLTLDLRSGSSWARTPHNGLTCRRYRP